MGEKMTSDTRSNFTNNYPINGKLTKYGKLQFCTRRQLMDYCLKMQEMAQAVDSALFAEGIIVTIDDDNKVEISKGWKK